MECKNCELALLRTNIVFFDGNKNADIMLIGEAPGADEDKTGLPFVGRAGKFLTKMLEDVGLSRKKDVYITNIVKCRPPQNRKPKPCEIEACSVYLEEQIKQVKPKIIVLIGATALSYFVEEKITISNARGKIFTHKDGIKMVPIFHPSYLLRNHSENPQSPRALTRQDLKNIVNLADFVVE